MTILVPLNKRSMVCFGWIRMLRKYFRIIMEFYNGTMVCTATGAFPEVVLGGSTLWLMSWFVFNVRISSCWSPLPWAYFFNLMCLDVFNLMCLDVFNVIFYFVVVVVVVVSFSLPSQEEWSELQARSFSWVDSTAGAGDVVISLWSKDPHSNMMDAPTTQPFFVVQVISRNKKIFKRCWIVMITAPSDWWRDSSRQKRETTVFESPQCERPLCFMSVARIPASSNCRHDAWKGTSFLVTHLIKNELKLQSWLVGKSTMY